MKFNMNQEEFEINDSNLININNMKVMPVILLIAGDKVEIFINPENLEKLLKHFEYTIIKTKE